MDSNRQYLLKINRNVIIMDLRIDDVVDELLSSKALSLDDYDTINVEKNEKEKTRKFLDIISKGDNAVYDEFVKSLKPYHDWLWKKLDVNNSSIPIEIANENVEDGLSRGEVPKLPLYYVSRSSLEQELYSNLKQLTRHKLLLIHGMPGSGKSSLIVSTLRNNNDLVLNTFKGNIYWINVGDCKSEEKIMQLQTRLLRRISNDEAPLNTSTSILSFGSMSSSFYEPDWEDYKDKLKKNFENVNLREALLVIDDLKDKKVIDAFNIGCKIIVTSQDSKLSEEYSPTVLNVPGNFAENESLQLIAQCVGRNVSELPHAAKDMHSICQGSPLLISMLGGILAGNKESLKHDKKRWTYFVKQLKNKPSFIDRFSFGKTSNDTYLAIEMCINSLENENFIEKYKTLAVLPDNVKVTVEALSTILDMDVIHVEGLMTLLKTKSLIIEHYHVDHKKYQYEIHDLITSYLKHIHKANELNKLHVDVLKNYMKKSAENNLNGLRDDGYIAYHIGYHIYGTGNLENMWDLFDRLYTDIEFIGAKIKLTGSSSIIDDFQYFQQIKGIVNYDANFVDNIKKFISNHGHDLHRYPNTDIVQSILQHEREGVLYEEACKLTCNDRNKNSLYLRFTYDQNEDFNYSTIPVDETLQVVRFWLHYIFVGNESGNIALWNINAYNKLLSFHGHNSAIKSLAINSIAPFKMASTCNDGILKIWNIDHLNHEMNDISSDSDEEENHFTNYYDIKSSAVTTSHPSGKLCDLSWGRCSNLLLTHTNPGNTVLLCNSNGAFLKQIYMGEKNSIACSVLSLDDSLAIIGFNSTTSKKYMVHMYCTKTHDLLITFTEYEEIKMLSLIPNEPKSILVLTDTYVHIHKWNQVLPSNSNQAIDNIYHLKICNNEINRQHTYTFQLATIGKNSCLFIATTDCHILVYDLINSKSLGVLNNHRGNVKTMDVIEYKCDHILITASGGDELSMKLWCVDPTQFSTNIIRKTIFDCVFHPKVTSYMDSPRISHQREYSEPSVRRAETMISPEKCHKIFLRKTLSLDKKTLRIMNVKHANDDDAVQPLIAVADSSNCIQVIKGNSFIGKTCKATGIITCVALSPCGHFLAYGMENGDVMNFSLKSMSGHLIMQIREAVGYMEFLGSTTLVVAGRENFLMLFEISALHPPDSVAKMIMNSRFELGSQELLDSFNGKRKTPELNGTNNNGSPTSDSSASSLTDHSVFHKYKTDKSLYKYTPTLKCFLIGKSELLSVSRDGSVKLWDFEPTLLSCLIGKQDIHVSCVCLKNSHLALCDRTGIFQIYRLQKSDGGLSIEARCVTKHHISEKIVCCSMSHDNKILAIGCGSGNIVLWHIVDKILIGVVNFHKIAVQYLEFSPSPLNCSHASEASTATPLILVSLAGQVAWWNITHILKRKKDFLHRQERNSILSPLANLSLNDSSSSDHGKSSAFTFPNTSWEKIWTGKTHKKKSSRKDLLACVKLTGERALKIKTDDTFSSFITVDQGGILCIMNVLNNNRKSGEDKSSSESSLI